MDKSQGTFSADAVRSFLDEKDKQIAELKAVNREQYTKLNKWEAWNLTAIQPSDIARTKAQAIREMLSSFTGLWHGVIPEDISFTVKEILNHADNLEAKERE